VDEKTLKELVRATKAVFLVQLQVLVEPNDRAKPEVVLARAGYGAAEIAKFLNKGQAAVAKSIQRAGKAA
jgi:hypothetical protein